MPTTTPASGRPDRRTPRKSRPQSAPQAIDRAADEASLTRLEQTRLRAFAFYEARGCEDGHELDDWLRAEAELDATPAPPVAH